MPIAVLAVTAYWGLVVAAGSLLVRLVCAAVLIVAVVATATQAQPPTSRQHQTSAGHTDEALDGASDSYVLTRLMGRLTDRARRRRAAYAQARSSSDLSAGVP